MEVAFRPGSDKSIEKGHSVSSSDITLEDVKAMHVVLLESIVKVATSEIGVRFRDLHIFKTSDLQSMSMNKLMTKIHPVRITKQMQQVLKEVFELYYEQVVGLDYHVGKGYNILKDSTTLMSPLAMEECSNQYGMPANVQLKECSSFEVKFESVEDTKEYIIK
ncbi:unnamed protein product [Mytilus coruscus]|uniref:Uncharacterized protein n=1 Tax=Mytilus coruscus TaxID=42192 RepID=A0A6J8EES7_MYTCO|nr:unnamed protein product [Mytilus coruscus]